MTATCRRCSECVGQSHHWLSNPDFGNDDEDEGRTAREFDCKHCDAAGRECDVCGGSGRGEGDDDSQCLECDGEGVIQVAP